MPFPDIDPVAFAFGPLAVRWYGLAYLAGLMFGWWYGRGLAARGGGRPGARDFDEFMGLAMLSAVIGGRVAYVLFYNAPHFLSQPLDALKIWQGGMSFHGGLAGVAAAIFVYARWRGFSVLRFGDLVAAAAPIGLFFGRLANFVNGELFGRVTEVPWGVVFPAGGDVPRHPSQLYEALLEGVVLFAVLAIFARRTEALRQPGLLSGIFFLGYGLSRTLAELFREPDPQLGFILGPATMGQLLSLPLILLGSYLVLQSLSPRKRGHAGR